MPSAQRVQWAKFRTSGVILAALTILATLVYLLTGGTIFAKSAQIYLYVPDATGLAVGSPVRADGVDVGKVARIELMRSPQPNRVIRVTLSINRKALKQLPLDSSAQLGAESLVGDMFVDIASGTSPEHLQPGSEISYLAQPELLKTLDLQQFQQALRSVGDTLTDIEQGKGRVGQFVMGTQFYQDLLKDMGDIENTVKKAAAVTGPFGQHLYTDQMYRQIRQPILELDRSLAAIQAGQGSLGSMLRDDAQYQRFLDLAQALRSSIQAIRSGPLITDDALYVNFSKIFGSLIRSVDEFNSSPMMLNSSAYENLNGLANQIRDSARDFHTNPKAYMWMKIF